jgi:HK97 family phage prohead protease
MYEIKTITGSVADIDSRTVKVAVSEMGNKDLDGDVISPGAYEKTVRERGPKGANLIWHLTDHNPSLKNALGKPTEIYTENNKLVFVTPVQKTAWGNDTLEMYKSGVINQHSIGFRLIKSEPVNAGTADEYRLIKEVLLYEGSAVLWGANPNTPTLSVGKSMTKEEAEKNFFDTVKELSNFTKLFRQGHLTDETFELIEMKMAQITEKLSQLYSLTTLPASQAVEPENDEKLLVINRFINNLKRQQDGRDIGAAASKLARAS